MKVTAYMHLLPEHIAYDPETRTVRLAKAARDWQNVIYPTAEMAAVAPARQGSQIYAVTAELPNDSVFEVRGSINQDDGSGGTYSAGYFARYGDAFEAAAGLGTQGHRGQILVKAGIDRIYTSYEDWKNEFDRDAARKPPIASERRSLRDLVELAPADETALGVADPEYALWLRLNERYGVK